MTVQSKIQINGLPTFNNAALSIDACKEKKKSLHDDYASFQVCSGGLSRDDWLIFESYLACVCKDKCKLKAETKRCFCFGCNINWSYQLLLLYQFIFQGLFCALRKYHKCIQDLCGVSMCTFIYKIRNCMPSFVPRSFIERNLRTQKCFARIM